MKKMDVTSHGILNMKLRTCLDTGGRRDHKPQNGMSGSNSSPSSSASGNPKMSL